MEATRAEKSRMLQRTIVNPFGCVIASVEERLQLLDSVISC